MAKTNEALSDLIGREVVLDTSGQFAYIGRLEKMDDQFVELKDCDVHDSSECAATKEIYIMDAKKYGIKKNRKSVFVRTDQVISVSRLEDVIEY